MKTKNSPTQPSVVAALLHHLLEANELAPAEVAERIYPRPRRGRDASASSRTQLTDSFSSFLNMDAHPDDAKFDAHEALAIDRIFGLPQGFCMLAGTLDDVFCVASSEGKFLSRVKPLPTPAKLDASYLVLVPKRDGNAIVFSGGKIPAGIGSFPSA